MRQDKYSGDKLPKGMPRSFKKSVGRVIGAGLQCKGTIISDIGNTIFGHPPSSRYNEVYLVETNGHFPTPNLYAAEVRYTNSRGEEVFNFRVDESSSGLEIAAREMGLRVVAHGRKGRVKVTIDGQVLKRIDLNSNEPSNGAHYYGF